ncbi:Hypothetical Protein FCC1311_028962 [Hondaea fermentalgiana]|uniref:Uncharacterized protein n=1 Tax=Hondaea fermentalgiana TaxID=2315210 RepID=A0A2R5G803_9STRA|nr:Hypothetical Protein FCC1311_028962 [Hondaea fermentalgiana]|eukprot:GBG26675.1 Hypothetical Protein FCC1311_028962 [Hondaea fermentalgiana]
MGVAFGPKFTQQLRSVSGVDVVLAAADDQEVPLGTVDSDDDYVEKGGFEYVFDHNSLYEVVERARTEKRFGQFIDSVSALRPGIVLLAHKPSALSDKDNVGSEDDVEDGDEDDDGSEEVASLHSLKWENPFTSDVILLTAHGGNAPTVGFVMNAKLPDAEARQAREMLRENSDADLFQGSERREIIQAAIRDKQRLWLGAGGPVRNPAHLWTHVHNCPGAAGAMEVAKGVCWRGDILELLVNDDCFVKLLYGSVVWSPGQLDVEVKRGLWNLYDADPSAIFEASADADTALFRVADQPSLPIQTHESDAGGAAEEASEH